MEAFSLPFLFLSMLVLWIAIERTLRGQRRVEAAEAKAEEEAQREASRRRS